MLCVIVAGVNAVTQLDDVLYVVCAAYSSILRFSATTHEPLENIAIKAFKAPFDIAACERTSQLYVADEVCTWRLSSTGHGRERWLSFTPHSLSVTSTRLLVTSSEPPHQLIQFDSVGDELRQVQLPDDVEPLGAVESPAGTFIVSHMNTKLNQHEVIEVNAVGEVLHQFSGSLGGTQHIAVDSHANVFVADYNSRCVLLLDNRLSLCRVIIDEHQLNDQWPLCLCYSQQSAQLLVGFSDGYFMAFDVLRC